MSNVIKNSSVLVLGALARDLAKPSESLSRVSINQMGYGTSRAIQALSASSFTPRHGYLASI